MTRSPVLPHSRAELPRGWWRAAVVVWWLASACAACNRQSAPEVVSLSAPGAAHSKPSAQEVPAVPRVPRPGRQLVDVAIPELRGHVNDCAGLLSADEARLLEAKLVAHEASSGQQFALLTVERLPGVNIEDFGYTVSNRWKLGRACFDDGVLLLISRADRKLRIDVGYGLEPAIPDPRAAQVIEEMVPLLRLQQFAAATNTAFDRLMAAANAAPAVRPQGCTDSPT